MLQRRNCRKKKTVFLGLNVSFLYLYLLCVSIFNSFCFDFLFFNLAFSVLYFSGVFVFIFYFKLYRNFQYIFSLLFLSPTRMRMLHLVLYEDIVFHFFFFEVRSANFIIRLLKVCNFVVQVSWIRGWIVIFGSFFSI